jgi:hypothetical protein
MMFDTDTDAEFMIEELPALPGAEFDEQDDAAGILLANNNSIGT